MLASTSIVYNRGKYGDFKIVDTHLGIPQRIKEKRKIKNIPKSSRHWSSIVIQILVNDHTNYIISLRAKCEAGREANEYWSTNNLM